MADADATTADGRSEASPQARTLEREQVGTRVTVIVPLLNEASNLEGFVQEIAAQDFEGKLEVLIADGGSTDGSVELLRSAAHAANLDLTIISNPGRWVSQGLNRCIARAQGDLIVRLDCHASYPPDYVRRCVDAAAATGAWNVGGVLEPVGETTGERSVACAMDSPFGGIGWTRRNSSPSRVEVDTVPYGAFRPGVFERVGLFDETLVRGQDDEFNLRLCRAGGRIVLDPTIRVRYRPRGSFRELFRQYFGYGFWKVHAMRKHRTVLSARSLAPPGFVASLAVLALSSPRSRLARQALGCELATYLGCALIFGRLSIRRRREPITLLPRVVAGFALLHTSYGSGMIAATAQLVTGTLRLRR